MIVMVSLLIVVADGCRWLVASSVNRSGSGNCGSCCRKGSYGGYGYGISCWVMLVYDEILVPVV